MRLLPEGAPLREIIHTVFPSRRGLLTSVRALIDFLAAQVETLDENQPVRPGNLVIYVCAGIIITGEVRINQDNYPFGVTAAGLFNAVCLEAFQDSRVRVIGGDPLAER